ncbi:uroporphyrinogen-III synthase [Salinibacillus kushneri]|nr:uroporphyrinogen-III synthase [Salinibacillus kushneri]
MNVLVTREKSKAESLSRLIKKAGGNPIEVPLLTFEWIHDESRDVIIQNLNQFDWIFFTSGNGVHFFMKSIKRHSKATEALKSIHIAAVGKKTSKTLKQYNLTVDFEPSHYTAEVMGEEFAAYYTPKKVLLVRGSLSRDVLPDFFSQSNIPYESITVYATKANRKEQENLKKTLYAKRLDAITFTSPSMIQAFFSLGKEAIKEEHLKKSACICIGSTTESEAKKKGFTNLIVPDQYTTAHMIEKFIDYVKKGRVSHE